MRMSQLFSQTLREAPADAEISSHQLLVRAGFIRQLGAGLFSYLPLARRAMNKVEAMLKERPDIQIVIDRRKPENEGTEEHEWKGPERRRKKDPFTLK